MSVSTYNPGPRRVDQLACPKRLPPGFCEDRRSVYWLDKRPLVSNGKTEFALTPRLAQLARHKDVNTDWLADRPTPEWPVSQSAKQRVNSQRMDVLAQHKPEHRDFQHHRSLSRTPTERRGSPSANPRLAQLALPKPHMMWTSNDEKYGELGEFCTPIWPVGSGVMRAQCSGRLESLAAHKDPHQLYLGERAVQWPVTDNAKNSAATLRLQQLARPKSGRMRSDDFDPYRVSAAAMGARVTPRVEELSAPIPRKVRQKPK